MKLIWFVRVKLWLDWYDRTIIKPKKLQKGKYPSLIFVIFNGCFPTQQIFLFRYVAQLNTFTKWGLSIKKKKKNEVYLQIEVYIELKWVQTKSCYVIYRIQVGTSLLTKQK